MEHLQDNIISVNETTYKVETRQIEAVIGDEKQVDFFPRMKLKKWNNECNFSVGLIDNDTATQANIISDGKQIVWEKNGKKASFYGIKKREDLVLNKIKWLKLGQLDPFVAAAEYELFRHTKWNDDEIVIATYASTEPAIMYFGNTHADDYVDYDAITIPQVRIPSPSANPYYFDQDLINIDMHYGFLKIPNLDKIWVDSMKQTLAKYGVDTYNLPGRGNKLFFKDGDVDVKFAHEQNALGIVAGYLNINCPYNKVYTEYYKPEEIPKYYDPSYGLQSKYPNIDHSLIDDFIQQLSENLNTSVEIIEYTPQQIEQLNQITNGVMKDPDWIRYGIREDAGWEHFENEDGFEFNIIYDSKPDSNVEELSIQTKGLEFYFQPPLEKEERITGHRPAHVVGSYAVYHESKQNNQYEAGKAFHIYRPIAEDSNGKKVWCDLSIDKINEKLFITIPQKFLDEALYPVTVDPTFGYSTIGASVTFPSGVITGSKFTGDVGFLEKLSIYFNPTSDSTKLKCALYKNSDSSLVADSEEKTTLLSGGSQFYVFKAGNIPTKALTAIDYIIVAWCDNNTYDSVNYDTGDTNQGRTQARAYGTWPDPASFSNTNNKYSMYATYVNGSIAWGEQNPNSPENAQPWTDWDDGAGGAVHVEDDPSWGQLALNLNDIGHSDVIYAGVTGVTRNYTITLNKYGSTYGGSFTTYIRGQETSFAQDDATPSWEVYSGTISRQWAYVQVKLVGN
jgi:hypothetical protein